MKDGETGLGVSLLFGPGHPEVVYYLILVTPSSAGACCCSRRLPKKGGVLRGIKKVSNET